MSTIRGRAVKVGGVAVEPAGFSSRTEGLGQSAITRPAYRSAASGQIQPAGIASGQGGGPYMGGMSHPLLDLSSVAGWRLVAVAVAVVYIWGFHVSLGGLRVGAGPR